MREDIEQGETHPVAPEEQDAEQREEASSKQDNKQRHPRKWWRRLLATLAWMVGGFIVLLLLLTALLYIPSVQDWVVQRSRTTLEQSTGYQIEIGQIRVGFPLKLRIREVHATDPESGKAIASVGLLTADVSLLPLLKGGNLPISGVTLEQALFDYALSGDSVQIYATIDRLRLNQMSLDLSATSMQLGQLDLRGVESQITLLTDTIPKEEEEEKEPSQMVIELARAYLQDIHSTILILPSDTRIEATIQKGALKHAEVNLAQEYYQVQEAKLETELASIGAELDFLPMPWRVTINSKGLRYGGTEDVRADLRLFDFRAGNEWSAVGHKLYVQKDSTNMMVEDIDLELQGSQIRGFAHLPFNGWIPDSVGYVTVDLRGKLSPEDITPFLGSALGDKALPHEALDFQLATSGYLEETLELKATLDSPALLHLGIEAEGRTLMAEATRSLRGSYQIQTAEELMPFVEQWLGSKPSWRIPAGVQLQGQLAYSPSRISTDLQMHAPAGSMEAQVSYHPYSKQYHADLQMVEMDLYPFLPMDSITNLSVSLKAEGKGTDPFAQKTAFALDLIVDSISFRTHQLKSITLLSELREHQLFAALNSPNEALQATAQLDMTLQKESLVGSVNLFVDTIIPKDLGLDIALLQGGKMELRSSLRSDMKERHSFEGEVENFFVTTDKKQLHPTNTYLRASSDSTMVHASMTSGDLALTLHAQNGLNTFTKKIGEVAKAIQTSLRDSISTINMAPWIAHYPDMQLSFRMGRNNALRSYLDEYRIGTQGALLELEMAEGKGLRGMAVVEMLQVDTFRIDNMDLILRQDSAFFNATATVHKERFRKQLPFNILLSLASNVRRTEAYLNWNDSKERPFVTLGLELWNYPNGDIQFGFTPDPLILAYNEFSSTPKDYIRLPRGQVSEIEAEVALRAKSGATINVHAHPKDEGREVLAEIRALHLAQLGGITFVPDLRGVLNLEATWLQRKEGGEDYSAKGTLKGFAFEEKEIGDLALKALAKSRKEGMQMEGSLALGKEPVLMAQVFKAKAKGATQLFDLQLRDLALQYANPFLPERYAELRGTLTGRLSNYDFNLPITQATPQHYFGILQMEDADLYVPALNDTYHLDAQPIPISGGVMYFNRFALRANESNLYIDGEVNLEQNLLMNLRLRGEDLVLLNSQQTKQTLLFGRINADTDLRLSGPAQALSIRGDLNLLGSTNVSYQSQKSSLESRNHYKGLVDFTDFSDTLFVAKREAIDSLSLGGIDLRLGIHIDPATKVNALLNKDGSNSLSIQGGGDLNLVIPPYDAMTLSGRYDINEGDIHVNIGSVLTPKFTIDQGSFLAWSGDPMTPDLNFKATSRVRSNVTMPGEATRPVDFDVSMLASGSLDNLQLRFVTTAPQDLSMRNLLAGLSEEEQNRQSITLLATKHFIWSSTGASSKGFDVNSTLTSLLASQLNSLAGDALDAEINLGMNDATNAQGTGVNYSYSITKSFYNNRISLSVGGKVMTGQAAQGLRQSFIDNVSLDYRLDEAGTHYLRLFHNKDYENLLDGEVTETGAGYVIRRRLDRLRDLFIFGKKKKREPQPLEQPLSTPVVSNTPINRESDEE